MSDAVPDADFELLLEYLRRIRGFDFGGYKRASLGRRIDKRMRAVGVSDHVEYVEFLDAHPEEFDALFDTILINVTAFFRDPAAWEVVGAQVVPRILASKRPDEPIRLWSAGCASGEEAYTLAMVVAEVVGFREFRERVKIYATDLDESALTKGRQAVYGAKEVQAIPPELLEKYFDHNNGRYSFHKDLRRSVIFGRHDLIQDAPISRIDLLSCRNTLMYLNSDVQSRILDRLRFALSDRGFLVLGKAESLLTYDSSFLPIDLKRRIFAKVSRGGLRERPPGAPRAEDDGPVGRLIGHVRIREAAFDTGPVAHVAVEIGGTLSLANDRARLLFNLTASDIGRPLQDLQVSYRPAELRPAIDRAYAERHAVVLRDVEWSPVTGEANYFEVHVTPLFDGDGSLLGAGAAFFETTAAKRLGDEHRRATRELETAYEELQSTNEELETTNEELQSTVEELETTSEELQSTNEELETMNEELQSTNEELETLNEELRERGEELRRVNTFLESILGCLRGGVAVVDADLAVQIWNPKAEDLWGLRLDEVRGRNLLSLDFGLPLERLRPSLRGCLSGEATFEEVTVGAINRRGRTISCHVTCTPMVEDGSIVGVVLVMEDESAAPARDGDGVPAGA